VGKSADKFYAEMNSALIPAVTRLQTALESASRVTTQISSVMKRAEDDAARVLRGEGGSPAGNGGTGGALASGPAMATPGPTGSGSGAGPAGSPSSGPGSPTGGPPGGGASNVTPVSATSRMLSQFAPRVQQLVDQSPTLQGQIAQLERDGWTITRGPAAGGYYTDHQNKRIVINEGGTPESYVGRIAHEVGHAAYGDAPYHAPTPTMTRDQFVRLNVNEQMRSEGAAQLNAATVRREISQAGGPDVGIVGTQTAAYQSVYDNFRAGRITRDQAIDQMGNLMGNESTSITGQNYRQYYGRTYENFWDTRVAPTRRP
jgi:hypothetical protein